MARKSFQKSLSSAVQAHSEKSPAVKSGPRQKAAPGKTAPGPGKPAPGIKKSASGSRKPASAGKKTASGRAEEGLLLDLNSDLTIGRAVELKNRFSELLQGKKKVKIISSAGSRVDVSFVQIVHAFRKEAREKGVEIEWELRVDEQYEKMLIQAGLLPARLFS